MDNKESQRVREFQEAVREEFVEDLPEKDARIMLQQLVQLYLLISRPLPEKS